MRYSIAATALLLASPCVAQDYLPPSEMVDIALDAVPEQALAEALSRAARADAGALQAGPYEWTMSGDLAVRTTRREGDFAEFELGVSRGVRLPGKSAIDRQIGALAMQEAELVRADTRHETARLLMSFWIDWLSAREKVELEAKREDLFEGDVEAFRKGVDAGVKPAVELDLALSALSSTRKARIEAEATVAALAAQLQTYFPDIVLPPGGIRISTPSPLVDGDEWFDKILSHDHEIERYQLAANIADERSRRARLDQKLADPEIGLRSFSERNGDEVGIGAFVSIPIGGRYRSAATTKALEMASAKRFEVDALRRQKSSMARQSIIMAESQFEAWKHALTAMESEAEAQQRMRQGYEIGAVAYQDLQQQEKRLSDASLAELEARSSAALTQLLIRVDAHELWLEAADDHEH